ncbi:MAG: GNAT family N-acetyltransferase [Parachlamydiaceae bacterium]|nr:GNAT family N-acetyltransferase [Parachlamydiaceae bacterium]
MNEVKDKLPSGIEIRYTEPEDGKYLREWLSDADVQRWFPMDDQIEIDDAVVRWIAFHRYKCSLTILKDKIPCGIATLYLQPYRKLAHQCEFGIIVGKGFRNLGIGSYLMSAIMHLARENFKIELLHLQVYAENPAINLYTRFGFKEFGRQDFWIKEDNRYVGRIFMERFL